MLGVMRIGRSACLAIAGLALLPGQAAACAVALAFALDVSASVDSTEYALQRDGLAEALEDPVIRDAILAQPGGVAFAAYEWSGRYQQDAMLDWTLVQSDEGISAVAGRIRAARRSYAEFPTAIGYALGHGAVLLSRAPPCLRRVIDISGDGIGNEGFGPAAAYREFAFEDVTVNGLVIGGDDAALVEYYRREIPHGPGAFVEIAENFRDYGNAMRRKLLRELFGPQVVAAP